MLFSMKRVLSTVTLFSGVAPTFTFLVPSLSSRRIVRSFSQTNFVSHSEEDFVLNNFLEKAAEAERRKQKSLEKEAKEAEKVEALNEWAQYVTANLWQCNENTRSLEIEKWDTGEKMCLTFSKDPKVEAEEAFQRCRKLRRGSQIVTELIKKSQKRLKFIQNAIQTTDSDEKLQMMHSLKIAPKQTTRQNTIKKQTNKKGWTGRTFIAPISKAPVLVGRNRKENDKLSIKIAKDGDLWFHARGSAGAHVLLQLSALPQNTPQADDDLLFAAEVAAFYSDASNDTKVRVTLALPRHVIKPPRAPPGAVILREEYATLIANPFKHAPRHQAALEKK